jgi:uncharacterized protein (DUF736 family)
MTKRASVPSATMSPYPRVSTDDAAKYSVVPRSAGTGRSWSRTANRIRPYPRISVRSHTTRSAMVAAGAYRPSTRS